MENIIKKILNYLYKDIKNKDLKASGANYLIQKIKNTINDKEFTQVDKFKLFCQKKSLNTAKIMNICLVIRMQ